MKLSPDWNKVSPSVYEIPGVVRIHMLGLIRDEVGNEHLDVDSLQGELRELYLKCLRIQGYDKKRAIMLLAEMIHLGRRFKV